MPRIRQIINKFTGGEVAPEVWGRTETNEWPSMVEKARNVFSNPRGGMIRRPGLHYVVDTKFPEKNSRLIPFIFSREQSYVLEFGDYYVRFFKDEGWIDNVGNISTYLGDGTSTRFVYPFASTLEADIEIYDETGTLIPIADATNGYSVTAIVPSTNYSLPFSDAGWDVDPDATGDPWVKSASQVTSPSGETTVLTFANAQIPVGGAYKYTVDVISVSDTLGNVASSNTNDIVLVDGDPVVSVVSVTATESVTTQVSITIKAQLEDSSGNRTSDFTWEIRHNTTVISTGTELLVGSPGLFLIESATIPSMAIGDTVSLHISATENHVQSLPQISGTTTPSTADIDYVIDATAGLRYAISDAGGDLSTVSIEPTVGTLTMIDSTATNSAPAPYKFLFSADRGLDITIDNPVLEFNSTGWVITFTNPPAIGTIRNILDKSLVSTAESSVSPTLNLSLNTDAIFEIQSPYSEADLEELYWVQANDVLLICHDLYKPRELTRYAPYDWRFEQNKFVGAPWEGESVSYHGDGTETVFSYSFDSTVDADIEVTFNGVIQTTGFAIDHTLKTVTFTPAPPDKAIIIIQGVNTYNPLFGYPRTCAYFQERLYFGGTVRRPQTLWGSRSADFHVFDFKVADPLPPDAAVEYTIAAYTHEAIEWLSSERVLIMGTSATEHRLSPDQYIATDRLPVVSRMSAYGGAHVMPAFMGNLTVFIATAGNQVRTFEQSGQSVIEKWDSLELDWKAKHLTIPKVKQINYALNPYSLLVMVTLDGDLLTMTYEPNMGETSEVGWTKQETDGLFKSMTVIPEDDNDQIWAIVERGGKRYIEYFDDTIFSDSVLTYPDKDFPNAPPIQSVSGLEHLEGKTVTIKTDEATHPDLVVLNGRVELNDFYSKVAIGLKYVPTIKLQRLAIAGEQANLQGQLGRWSEVWLRIVDSAYPLVDGKMAPERRSSTVMDTVEPIVTGDVKYYHLGWDRNKQLTITQELPVPLQVVSVFGVVTVESG